MKYKNRQNQSARTKTSGSLWRIQTGKRHVGAFWVLYSDLGGHYISISTCILKMCALYSVYSTSIKISSK